MNRFAAMRAGYGALLLLAPDPVIRLYSRHRVDRRTRVVVRLLGVRHLAQAVLTAGTPDRAVLALGVEADLAHAASMVGLAACDRARTRAALVDAVGAGSFAAAGAALACRTPRTPIHPAGGGLGPRLAAVRDAAAGRLARWLLPAGLHPPRAGRVSKHEVRCASREGQVEAGECF